MNIFWILVGVFVLGVMVLVHEWGHFIVAKLLGVRVEIFSIGFGPRLFGRQKGPTDYRISALPLGGYVKMAGDNPGVERTGAPDEFLSQSRWRRTLIVLAGPGTNILMAVVLLAGLYAVRYERPAYLDEPARLEGVIADSPAAQAGLAAGDIIVEMDGKTHPTWEQVQLGSLLNGSAPLRVTVQHGGDRLTKMIQPELQGDREIPYFGWYPYDPVVLEEVEPKMAAGQAGLQAGDVLLAVDGKSTSGLGRGGLVEAVQGSEGKPLELTITRKGETLTYTVAAEKREWNGRTAYFLGVQLGSLTDVIPLGPVQALNQSLKDNLSSAGLLFQVLQRLVVGRLSVRTLEGPIGIVSLSGQAARLGWLPLINLMAIISINLAVLNLLPIPILDGGHIALMAVEGIRGRDLSLGFKERVTQIGLALLLLLFVVVMYNDIMRYFFQ